jgi:hypothetical protein
MSDITKPTPTRAAVVLGIGIALVLTGIGAAHANEWTTADTYREVAYQSVAAVDWLQTRQIAKTPTKWQEQNNLLGRHPSVSAVNHYFLVTGIGHALLSNHLDTPYRAVFQDVTIGLEILVVNRNIGLGINARF